MQSGDTLSGISAKYYPGRVQTGVKLLAEANKHLFADPRTMREGMVLTIPAVPASAAAAAPASTGGTVTQPTPGASEPAPAAATDGEYVVQSGDTLERIARKLFNDGNRWNDLYEWNRDRLPSPGRLQIGQKLRVRGNMPASASARGGSESENAVEIITPQPRVTAGSRATHERSSSEGESTDTADAAPVSSSWMP
ncbi:MAG: LysM peptidoglycan-binding domain-containing protein [Dehalococcoidia bacterium]|nr:LysM peptidoglycan-binding domain-containing protein [Dehalococcoidia bacterium]